MEPEFRRKLLWLLLLLLLLLLLSNSGILQIPSKISLPSLLQTPRKKNEGFLSAVQFTSNIETTRLS